MGVVATIRHVSSADDGIAMHLAVSGLRGRAQLLAGMVRTNRPWRLVPNLSPALAAAAAGAAFGVFYPSIWNLAEASGGSRLLLVSVLAVLAMSMWLIANNRLWEQPLAPAGRTETALFNVSTVLTVVTGVTIMYVALFALTLGAAVLVIPPGYLAENLAHPVGSADYAGVAWLAASLGTVAGALGSGLADPEAVRKATYSRREQERRELFQRLAKEDGG